MTKLTLTSHTPEGFTMNFPNDAGEYNCIIANGKIPREAERPTAMALGYTIEFFSPGGYRMYYWGDEENAKALGKVSGAMMAHSVFGD